MKRQRVFIVEGDPDERQRLRAALVERGFDAVEAATAGECLTELRRGEADAVLASAELPDGTAAAMVARAREMGSDAGFVVAGAASAFDRIVEALRAGADSFVLQPLHPEQVSLVLEKVQEKRRLMAESGSLRDLVRERYTLVGNAPELQLVREVIRRAAPTKATVLVVGESGTGKELVAQALHEASPRREQPFLRLNCAALSEALLESELFGHERGAFADAPTRTAGKLELADGGTMFLNEVSNLSPASQVKLLRVLQQGEFERMGGREAIRVDVRVVASTQRDLAQEVHAGRFRDDLYYRLNVVTVALPALRQRKADIPALAEHFMEAYRRSYGKEIRGFTPGALSALFSYDWPGNVRELENAVEAAVRACQGSEIGSGDLSPVLHGARPVERTASALIPGASLFEIEREAILRTLEEAGGSTARAAEVLGISVRKIQYRLKEYRTGHLTARHRAPAPERPALDRLG
jgi:DNA-binding NtrC family response regulator